MKSEFNTRKILQILGGVLLLGVIAAILMDLWIMPYYTNYNEGVTVPDVTRLPLDEAEALLETYGLRHEVLDRRAHSAYPANFIIDQTPEAKQIVKPDRKVYLIVNTDATPKTVVPNVVNLSLRNAEIQLENHGLAIGTRSYETSRFINTILRQSVAAGDTVARGTVVDLTVSDGLGSRMVQIPDLSGMTLIEAQQELLRAGLTEEIRYQPTDEAAPNTVISYTPNSGRLPEGDTIQLIVAERMDAREEIESGAIVDDSTSVNNNLENIDEL